MSATLAGTVFRSMLDGFRANGAEPAQSRH
jgi:hypothetical protein